jgi:hypothetical protein
MIHDGDAGEITNHIIMGSAIPVPIGMVPRVDIAIHNNNYTIIMAA